MKEPVELGSPRAVVGLAEHGLEVVEGLLLGALDTERAPQVTHVVDALQLRDAGRQHHGEESDEQVGVAAQGEVRLSAEELELGKLLALARVLLAQRDHIEEIVREDEWNSLAADAKLFLEMTEKVAEVDVKYLPVFVDLERRGKLLLDEMSKASTTASLTMMLSGCLSPMPRMNVATQYPAQLLVKVSKACSTLFSLCDLIHL